MIFFTHMEGYTVKYFLICILVFCKALNANLHYIDKESTLSGDPKELYIDLLKRTVTNIIYDYSPKRESGYDIPVQAHTMIGMKRVNNIHELIKNIIENDTPGDLVETGVWRGGATILMRGILKAYNITDRKVWVCDSFQGLPPPNTDKYPADKGLNWYLDPQFSISLDTVQANFSRYGLLDNQVIFLEGFFRDTLPTAPIDNISLLRLDGDLYESTMDSLINLYPKLSVGGFVIIDDMCIPACVKAVNDFRRDNSIASPLIRIDQTGYYWQKLTP